MRVAERNVVGVASSPTAENLDPVLAKMISSASSVVVDRDTSVETLSGFLGEAFDTAELHSHAWLKVQSFASQAAAVTGPNRHSFKDDALRILSTFAERMHAGTNKEAFVMERVLYDVMAAAGLDCDTAVRNRMDESYPGVGKDFYHNELTIEDDWPARMKLELNKGHMTPNTYMVYS